MRRQDIKTKRMLDILIDSTASIIEEQGIENVTVRKIGERAGYTGPHIYNYFEESSHLIFFASLRFLDDYIKELTFNINKDEEPIDKYLSTWHSFCKYSFNKPHIYHTIFISDLGVDPNDLLKSYYSIYSDELLELPEEIKFFVLENNLSARTKGMLKDIIDNDSLSLEDVNLISDTTILIWKGMLLNLLNNRLNSSAEEVAKQTMAYIRELVFNYVKKEPYKFR